MNNSLITQAMLSVEAALPQAKSDPARPVYHFHPPAQWMNDPNGPLFYRGYYHLFYQHNPFADVWGPMYWGHARSPDLVQWKHLLIALWPSLDKQETHCFSGCAWVDERGQPLLFYTKVEQMAKQSRPMSKLPLSNGPPVLWTTTCSPGKNIRPTPSCMPSGMAVPALTMPGATLLFLPLRAAPLWSSVRPWVRRPLCRCLRRRMLL